MCENYTNIIGTLSGVLLGWFLGILSNFGKVRVETSNKSFKFYEKDNGGSLFEKELNEKTIEGEFSFDLIISNKSRNNKLLKGICCVVEVKKKKENKPFKTRKAIINNIPNHVSDILEIINLSSQSISKRNLVINFSEEELKNIINSKTKIYLQYKNIWGLFRKKKKIIALLKNGKFT